LFETIPGKGAGEGDKGEQWRGIKENSGGAEFKYDIFDTL
jgi:hypothetical protein